MTTGAELKEARERAGLTQQAIADHLRVSRVTVVGWEGKAEVKKLKAERFLQAVLDLSKAAA